MYARQLFIMTVEQDLFMRCANAWKFFCFCSFFRVVKLQKYREMCEQCHYIPYQRVKWCDTGLSSSIFCITHNFYFKLFRCCQYCCCLFTLLRSWNFCLFRPLLFSLAHQRYCIDNKISLTYPNRWHHFVQLYWQSINQLSSIERLFVLTIWMSGGGVVFQQISLSSTLCVYICRLCCCCWSMI